jgi:hypothetical protein
VVDDMYEMTPDVLKNFSDLEPDFGKESILWNTISEEKFSD